MRPACIPRGCTARQHLTPCECDRGIDGASYLCGGRTCPLRIGGVRLCSVYYIPFFTHSNRFGGPSISTPNEIPHSNFSCINTFNLKRFPCEKPPRRRSGLRPAYKNRGTARLMLQHPMPVNDTSPSTTGTRRREDALHLGARKKPCVTHISYILSLFTSIGSCVSDPLVHHGRHFGRTIHAMSNVQVLITNGLLRMGELADQPEETFAAE